MKCPENGQYYSLNYGNLQYLSRGVKDYIKRCESKNGTNGGPYTQRYTGSLVSDIHRNLIKGGIFMYPATEKLQKGKLRLMYECNPLAFILEVAGGRAINGNERILDIVPSDIHERSPLFIGSANMIAELEECLKK
jgi:fructose-1,6-bisphosphatase I